MVEASTAQPVQESMAAGAEHAHPADRKRDVGSRLARITSWQRDLWVVALLAIATVAVWARPALPGFGHLRLSNPGDSNSFEFYLGWNVHALLQGDNPFFTPVLYAPDGMDLANAISVPAVSLLVAPVTLIFGATAGYNTAFLLAIFLGALAVFLLARELFGSTTGAAIAGALMVVSPYQGGHALGHLNMMWVFGLPFLAFLMVRHVRGRLSARWLLAGVALTVAFTLGASTELFATQAVFALIGVVIASVVATGEVRRRLARATAWLIGGVIVGCLLGSPVIWAAFSGGVPEQPANPAWMYSTDLTNIVAPSDVNLIGDSFFNAVRLTWLGNSAENTAYVPATLLLLVLASITLWSDRRFRALLVFAVVALVLSFGPYLNIAGKRTLPMPWRLVEHTPPLDHALPVRFSAFVFMAVTLIVAGLWASRRVRRWFVGAGAAAGFLLAMPDLSHLGMPVDTSVPAYVADGGLEEDVDAGENVLVLPPGQWGPGMRWLEETGFDFAMPTGNGGGAAAPPALQDPTGLALFTQDPAYPWRKSLPDYLAQVDVDTVLVDAASPQWQQTIERIFPGQGRLTDGVWVYELGDPVGAAERARVSRRERAVN